MLDEVNSVEIESPDGWAAFTEADAYGDINEEYWNCPEDWSAEILSEESLPQAMGGDWRAIPILNLSGPRIIYVCGTSNGWVGYQFTANNCSCPDTQPVPPPGRGWFLYDQGENGINWWVRSNKYKLTA